MGAFQFRPSTQVTRKSPSTPSPLALSKPTCTRLWLGSISPGVRISPTNKLTRYVSLSSSHAFYLIFVVVVIVALHLFIYSFFPQFIMERSKLVPTLICQSAPHGYPLSTASDYPPTSAALPASWPRTRANGSTGRSSGSTVVRIDRLLNRGRIREGIFFNSAKFFCSLPLFSSLASLSLPFLSPSLNIILQYYFSLFSFFFLLHPSKSEKSQRDPGIFPFPYDMI